MGKNPIDPATGRPMRGRPKKDGSSPENGAGHNSRPYTEEELFELLVECEPRVAEAQAAKQAAADREKDELEVLAAAFGSAAAAKKRLALFRRAQTPEGEAEAVQMIEMHQRVAAWRNKPIGYIQDMFAPGEAERAAA